MSKTGKTTQKESGFVVAKGWDVRKMESDC